LPRSRFGIQEERVFVGHFAVGFAGKRFEPRVSLFNLMTAALLADILWCGFLIAGVEHAAIRPGITRVNPLDLYDFPLSHSLLTDAIWAALFAGIYCLRSHSARAARVIVAAVLSHWVLDFVSHRPDMPLVPGVHKYFGLGLWNSVPATVVVEGGMWLAAIILYVRGSDARGPAGVYGFWIPLGLLTLLWLVSLNGAPPPSLRVLKTVNAVLISLSLAWTYWLDRTRLARVVERPTGPQAKGASR
jgi:hypothetical protein